MLAAIGMIVFGVLAFMVGYARGYATKRDVAQLDNLIDKLEAMEKLRKEQANV
jgi:hypothetical protein